MAAKKKPAGAIRTTLDFIRLEWRNPHPKPEALPSEDVPPEHEEELKAQHQLYDSWKDPADDRSIWNTPLIVVLQTGSVILAELKIVGGRSGWFSVKFRVEKGKLVPCTEVTEEYIPKALGVWYARLDLNPTKLGIAKQLEEAEKTQPATVEEKQEDTGGMSHDEVLAALGVSDPKSPEPESEEIPEGFEADPL